MSHDNIHETPDVSHISNEGVSHEVSDVNVKAIVIFTLFLLLFCGVTLGLVKIMQYKFEEQAAAQPEDRRSPMAMKDEKDRLPPEPRLQGAPGFQVQLENSPAQLLELREPAAQYQLKLREWKQILEHGTKADGTGIVTALPIEQAMDAVVSGETDAKAVLAPIKVRPHAAADQFDKLREIPSGASAGRRMEKRYQ